jgi:hypothetical protein
MDVEHLKTAYHNIAEQPLLDARSFMEKLKDQLGGERELRLLGGELLVIYYLFAWAGSISAEKKRARVNEVLGWANDQLPQDSEVWKALGEQGIGHPGQYFLLRPDVQLGFVLDFAIRLSTACSARVAPGAPRAKHFPVARRLAPPPMGGAGQSSGPRLVSSASCANSWPGVMPGLLLANSGAREEGRSTPPRVATAASPGGVACSVCSATPFTRPWPPHRPPNRPGPAKSALPSQPAPIAPIPSSPAEGREHRIPSGGRRGPYHRARDDPTDGARRHRG